MASSTEAAGLGAEPRALALGVALAAAGFAVRLAVDPLLGEEDTYIVFYPVVAIAAFFLGSFPAALVAVLSAIIGFGWFDHREMVGSPRSEHWTPLLVFLASSAVIVGLAAKMRQATFVQTSAKRQAEVLATDYAILFGEMNARVTNHLQLIAGLLQVHARHETSLTGRAFEEASAHTLVISKLHRDLAGDGRPMDFGPLARRLVEAAGLPPGLQVDVAPGELWLLPEQATAAAVVLLEQLRAHQAAGKPTCLQLNLRSKEQHAQIELVASSNEQRPDWAPPPRLHFVEAMVEQLGGRFQQRETASGSTGTLAFPLAPPDADHPASAVTLH